MLYQSLIAELSETELPIFKELLDRVEQLEGNLDQLSADDQVKLARLVATYNASVKATATDMQVYSATAAAIETQQQAVPLSPATTQRLGETEFGVYLLASVNEFLCQGGASTADAIRYAFHNRWMPEKLKNRDICEDLYYRYQDDIEEANQGIQQHSSSDTSSDTMVAVGLAWFTTLYQYYQQVEAEGDV